MISGIGLRVWENRVFLLPHQTLKDSLNRLQIVILWTSHTSDNQLFSNSDCVDVIRHGNKVKEDVLPAGNFIGLIC